MSTFLSRIGAIESRVAAGITHTQGARSNGWVCKECRSRGLRGQWRGYTRTGSRGEEAQVALSDGHEVSVQDPYADIYQWRDFGSTGLLERQKATLRDTRRRRRTTASEIGTSETAKPGLTGSTVSVGQGDTNLVPAKQPKERKANAFRWDANVNALLPDEQRRPRRIDGRKELEQALVEKNPHRIMDALRRLSGKAHAEYLAQIPPNTFTEMLELLDPELFMQPFRPMFKEGSVGYARYMRYKNSRNQLNRILGPLTQAVATRYKAGLKPDLADYRSLLKWCAVMGKGSYATKLWGLMQRERMMPDTDMYNHYMAARIWNLQFEGPSDKRYRVTAVNTALRTRRKVPGRQMSALVRNYRIGDDGIESLAVDKVNELTKLQLQPNEHTYRLLITAMAREGNVKRIGQVLNLVWGVDLSDNKVPERGNFKPEPKRPAMQSNHPLFPSPALLPVVAHIYGTNNDVTTALRLIVQIAEMYKMDVPQETWEELFEHILVLTKVRARKSLALVPGTGDAMATISMDAANNVWEAIRQPPFNVKPTIPMYKRMISLHYQRGHLLHMVKLIAEAKNTAYPKSQTAAHNAYKLLERAKDLHFRGLALNRSVEDRRRAYRHAELVRRRDYHWITRWVRQLFSYQLRKAHGMGRPSYKGERIIVPMLIEKFIRHLPPKFAYRTSEGVLEIKLQDEKEVRRFKERELRTFFETPEKLPWRRSLTKHNLWRYNRIVNGITKGRLTRWRRQMKERNERRIERPADTM